MTTEEIKAELKEVSDNIHNLSNRKIELEEMLLNSIDDMDEKFRQWKKSSTKKHCTDWYDFQRACPLLANELDSDDFTRHVTYELPEYSEKINAAFNTDEYRAKYWPDLDVEKWKKIGFELMNANVGSFEYDW